jgi:hypothetical protein
MDSTRLLREPQFAKLCKALRMAARLELAYAKHHWQPIHAPKCRRNRARVWHANSQNARPTGTAALIRAYDTYQSQIYGKGAAQQDYEFLSEFTHPNGTALHTYYQWKNDGHLLSFELPSAISPASFINRCLVDMLRFINDLLKICEEETVRPRIVTALKAMIAAAERAGIARKE